MFLLFLLFLVLPVHLGHYSSWHDRNLMQETAEVVASHSWIIFFCDVDLHPRSVCLKKNAPLTVNQLVTIKQCHKTKLAHKYHK